MRFPPGQYGKAKAKTSNVKKVRAILKTFYIEVSAIHIELRKMAACDGPFSQEARAILLDASRTKKFKVKTKRRINRWIRVHKLCQR